MMGAATGLALADDLEAAEKRAGSTLDRARTVVETFESDTDVDVDTTVRVDHAARTIVDHAARTIVDHAARTIVDHAARTIVDHAADLDTVVIGSHGGSLSDRLFVGNVAETVLHSGRGRSIPGRHDHGSTTRDGVRQYKFVTLL